ncbi:unnamed protein product [Lactuca saligna]|uniref:Uncharacterized protein n=1 Tax=Lactuca saligna TaxID=75948 RepID=A0AA36E692_LACSI|nr:unnamed protein product [Lactuca saligna]
MVTPILPTNLGPNHPFSRSHNLTFPFLDTNIQKISFLHGFTRAFSAIHSRPSFSPFSETLIRRLVFSIFFKANFKLPFSIPFHEFFYSFSHFLRNQAASTTLNTPSSFHHQETLFSCFRCR